MSTPIDPQAIRTFLVTELIGEDDFELALDEPIFSAGLLDSLSVVRLMAHLEAEYAIRLDPGRVSLEDFDTVEKIVTLLERLRGAA